MFGGHKVTDIEHLARLNALENRCIKLEDAMHELISAYNNHKHSQTEPIGIVERAKTCTPDKIVSVKVTKSTVVYSINEQIMEQKGLEDIENIHSCVPISLSKNLDKC